MPLCWRQRSGGEAHPAATGDNVVTPCERAAHACSGRVLEWPMHSVRLGLVIIAFSFRTVAAQPAAPAAEAPPAAPAVAAAPSAEDQARSALIDILPTLGKNILTRIRRGTALGLFAGAGGGMRFTDDVGNGGEWRVSGGLAFQRFAVPVLPSVDEFRRAAVSQIVEELKTYPRDASGQYNYEVLQRVARRVVDLLLAKYDVKHFEKPSLFARLEVAKLLKSDAWEAGVMVGVGIGPVTVGGGPLFIYGDRAALYGALEIGKPVLLSKGARAPVLDIFLRANLAATTRDQNPDQLVLGARIGFDAL